MKRFAIVLAAMALMMSTSALAENGATIYKMRCAKCHGKADEGKNGPALKGTKVDIAALITTGGHPKGPHHKAIAGITEGQAKMVAEYVANVK
jgi:mono/diheme cytochrome c family protein